MKSSKLGRLELLSWINEITECDYPKIEFLSDGIGFSQILLAIHPKCLQLSSLNFNARFVDDFTKNWHIIDRALTKIKADITINIEKIAAGNFQENMNFLQWIYNYTKQSSNEFKTNGYNERLIAFEKQNGRFSASISPHLIPNSEFLRRRASDIMEKDKKLVEDEKEEKSAEIERKIKKKMESNWKLMHASEDILIQRNTLFMFLRKIETKIQEFEDCEEKTDILEILKYTPSDLEFPTP